MQFLLGHVRQGMGLQQVGAAEVFDGPLDILPIGVLHQHGADHDLEGRLPRPPVLRSQGVEQAAVNLLKNFRHDLPLRNILTALSRLPRAQLKRRRTRVEDTAMSKPLLRSVPLGRWAEIYWTELRQPLTALVFIAPLLAGYEAGVLMLGPKAIRNGADTWLRNMLDLLGFTQYWLLPVLTISVLLGWHYVTRRPWSVSGYVLYGMVGE